MTKIDITNLDRFVIDINYVNLDSDILKLFLRKLNGFLVNLQRYCGAISAW